MINKTEMMQQILKSENAQRIIDFVSQIYGESYVGLWLFEVIGQALDEVYTSAVGLRDETSPVTAVRFLDLYEDHYGLLRDPSLNTKQRQKRIIAKMQSRGPCNPTRLAEAVSGALGGAEVDIIERVDKYTFLVIIREVVNDLKPARDILDQMKPAHLIYIIQTTIQTQAETNVYMATAVTRSEQFKVEVYSP